VLFLIAIFFAPGPENFSAFTAYEDEILTAAPYLAAAALAAAGALAPYKTAEFAWLILAYPGRITRSLIVFFAFALLRVFHGLLALTLLRVFHGQRN
jgi:hypothetical protein